MSTTTLGAIPVGGIVRIEVNNILQEFIVVHRGRPSALYDEGFNNGIVVMQRNIVEIRRFNDGADNNNYWLSNIRVWSHSIYLNQITQVVRDNIKQVRIPVRTGSGNSHTVSSGSNGMPASVFFLSMYEVGFDATYSVDMLQNPDGTRFSYFLPGLSIEARERRGTNQAYWTRTPRTPPTQIFNAVWTIRPDGSAGHLGANASMGSGVRPVFVLPPTLLVLANGTVTINTAPTTPPFISVPSVITGGTTINISWGESTDAEDNLAGYRLERSTTGGSTWQQIYEGADTNTNDYVGHGIYSVMYRVRAFDTEGLQSGFRTSNQIIVYNPVINTPPSTPGVIIIPEEIHGGTEIQISWGLSTDAENNLAGYRLYKSTDGGTTWYNVYDGPELSTTSFIFFGTESVIFRVRAYDTEGLNSGYRTSDQVFVINIHPSHENFREANITEIRIFENPEDTANSKYDVALPITVPGAIVGLDEYLDIFLTSKGLI